MFEKTQMSYLLSSTHTKKHDFWQYFHVDNQKLGKVWSATKEENVTFLHKFYHICNATNCIE